jgi:signal transduction histidine kinase
MILGGQLARPHAAALVAMALIGLFVSLFGIAGVTGPPPVSDVIAVIRALAAPAFLAAAALRLAHWHITGEPRSGLRGTALLIMGGVSLPSVVLARTLSTSGEGLAVATCIRAMSVGAILYVMAAALSENAVHRHDLRRRAGLVAVIAVAVSVLLLVERRRLPLDPSLHALLTRGLATALAIAWLTLSVGALVKGRHADWARMMCPLLAALGLAEVCRIPDRPSATMAAAGLTAAVGFAVAASALVDLVRAAQAERTAAETLTRELTDARTAVSDRDAWRADLTHDARGTLAGIRAAISTLDREADELDPATADRLRRATMAELTHLEQMLEHRDAEEDVFDAADVVRTVTDVRRAAGLRVDVTLCPARVRGISGDLASVLQNLLVNANEHAPGAAVRVDLRPDGARARIVVADDGPGIPSTSGRSAFGRGVRRPGSNGSGLGLSIARALTSRHGGELDLLPSAHGTTFVISWPLAEHRDAAPLRLEAVS